MYIPALLNLLCFHIHVMGCIALCHTCMNFTALFKGWHQERAQNMQLENLYISLSLTAWRLLNITIKIHKYSSSRFFHVLQIGITFDLVSKQHFHCCSSVSLDMLVHCNPAIMNLEGRRGAQVLCNAEMESPVASLVLV